MRKLFLSVFAAVVAFTAVAQQRVNGPAPEFIPNDPAVRTGQLEKGMKYYIRHNL